MTSFLLAEDEALLKKFETYLSLYSYYSQATISSYKSDILKWMKYRYVLYVEKYPEMDRENRGEPPAFSWEELMNFLLSDPMLNQSASTRSRFLSACHKFFLFLEDEEQKESKDFFDAEKKHLLRSKHTPQIPSFLTLEEVEALLQAPSKETYLGRRDHCILELLYSCGLRVSELVSLQYSHYDAQEKLLLVVGKGKRERFIPLSEVAYETLSQYLQKDRHYWQSISPSVKVENLFLSRDGKPISRVSIWKMVRKYAQKIGISQRVYPHILRHTFATHLISRGADIRIVQELLGHASMNTTQIYTHVVLDDLKKMIQEYHPFFRK